MLLFIDNKDSFTYNLADYFSQLGVNYKIYRNDIPFKEIIKEDYSGVILSPGPGTPASNGCLMQVIDYYHEKLPILGICLGHQAIGEYFGASLGKCRIPMHGKSSVIHSIKDAIFMNLPSTYNVVRYHSLIVEDVTDELIVLAKTEIGEIMAMKHSYLPIYGLQFHPEAILTEFGKDILENWLKLNNIAT